DLPRGRISGVLCRANLLGGRDGGCSCSDDWSARRRGGRRSCGWSLRGGIGGGGQAGRWAGAVLRGGRAAGGGGRRRAAGLLRADRVAFGGGRVGRGGRPGGGTARVARRAQGGRPGGLPPGGDGTSRPADRRRRASRVRGAHEAVRRRAA